MNADTGPIRWAGRFAPSPTGALHLGNLRTGLVAWLVSRAHGAPFVVRMEDLDPVVSRREHADGQLSDLAALGLDWDGPVVFQSDRHELYAAALDHLRADDRVYECFCTRKEIQTASQAPNGPSLEGRYPGTCRQRTNPELRRLAEVGRPPALRLRTDVEEGTVTDLWCGEQQFPIDDLVLRRNDGTWAYNLAVVVDDADQGIEVVVRGNDLLPSTPRQQHVAHLLGLPAFRTAHVALAVNADGVRLAKRDGAVTLGDQRDLGRTPAQVLTLLAQSLELIAITDRIDQAADLLPLFRVTVQPPTVQPPNPAAYPDKDLPNLPQTPWIVPHHLRA
jgi:glutamyl-tRNA synthetase